MLVERTEGPSRSSTNVSIVDLSAEEGRTPRVCKDICQCFVSKFEKLCLDGFGSACAAMDDIQKLEKTIRTQNHQWILSWTYISECDWR